MAGGRTALPRSTENPRPGMGHYEARIPQHLTRALRRLADDLTMPLNAVTLTAHIKVLAALSGEREVCTGYACGAGAPLPFRMNIDACSWRDLLQTTGRAESALRAHKDYPVETLKRELGLTASLFETVFVADAHDGWAEQAMLQIEFAEGDILVLRLRYRTDVLDADCAARIAGYLITALALMAADPDAPHARRTLLSAEELQFQIHGLTRRSELPDCTAHALFEEQARVRPDAIAAVHDGKEISYRELNGLANRLARALLTRGLPPEGVVGVVTERNLHWLTAVLAIFKAGGAYLPIEPNFPADRIAKTLSRAGCRLVLTERGSTTQLDHCLESMPDIDALFIDDALAEDHAGTDLGLAIAPNRLAYIFFTSGSTGEPKGAMCEHAGLLNHLYAKIADLGIGAADVVAQTAPQCFDISLWQLVCALMAGGRTLVVPQETILDAERFIDEIANHRVAVLQVVPSYLEVVVSTLTRRPRALPHLRCVSATGEALKKELVERWFAVQPGIKLMNAYGLTETSDDTNHEVMDKVPQADRIPLGRPVANVYIYIVDDALQPVPLGAPGEIVFSGVCVGRGYINDADRTARAFLADPHRAGERLYRSGDYGRWLPDGKLEFLGRQDAQVKVRGFRIEIGEIENRLLQLPGVREGAVVVTERADGNKQLVAFYAGDESLDPREMRNKLGESLPGYMVPAAIHWRKTLPLTGNGKVDRKALATFAGEIRAPEQDCDRPNTPTEQRLADAWAEVLGIPADQIGPDAQFFDLGGTSLAALRLVVKLNRVVSLKDLTAHPVLADLALLVDERSDGRQPPGSGRLSSTRVT